MTEGEQGIPFYVALAILFGLYLAALPTLGLGAWLVVRACQGMVRRSRQRQ